MAEEPAAAAQDNDSSNDHVEVDEPTEGGWVQWFCSLEGNDFFVEVEEDFIRDQFNLYGIKHKLDHAKFKYSSPSHPVETAWTSFSPHTLQQKKIFRTRRTLPPGIPS